MANKLIDQSSPYLQAHAEQPIEWWPWGEEAFAEARRRDVPVLISIGYSSCHWCHVMAEESFENEQIAAVVNQHVVAIKVDREERPDVDAVFMNATQALTGQGGWPMTVFTTPEGQPFFAGTYFPPEPDGGMPGFGQVVTTIAAAWRDRRQEVVAGASVIVEQLAQITAIATADKAPDVWPIMEQIAADFDVIHGGFGGAPKFPAPLLIDALLVKGDPGTLDLAQRTLEAMARGGIYDQVGGGFHRYSVDAAWVVPHFEKMLTDNALLLGSYVRGWRRTPTHEPQLRWLFERTVRGIIGWLERAMVTDEGGFASSLDADSADITGARHEGIYYVWSPELLTDALDEDDANWAIDTFHVTTVGSFEHGLSTLQLRGAPDVERLARVTERLRTIRATRFVPPRDGTVIASGNGWMISSLVQAAMVFGEASWLELARRAAEQLWSVHWTGTDLMRTSLAGETGQTPGAADDYGAVAEAFAQLAGVLGESIWLDRAVQILGRGLDLFDAGDGGFYDAVADDSLFVRPRTWVDNPVPCGASALTTALRTVSLLTGRADWAERADEAATTSWGVAAEHPRMAPAALSELLLADETRKGLAPAVAVVVTDNGDPLHDAARAVWRMAPVGTVVVAGRPGTTGFAHHFEHRLATIPEELRAQRAAAADAGTMLRASIGGSGQVDDDYHENEIVETGGVVYVCRGTTCFEPASTVQEIRTALWSRA